MFAFLGMDDDVYLCPFSLKVLNISNVDSGSERNFPYIAKTMT